MHKEVTALRVIRRKHGEEDITKIQEGIEVSQRSPSQSLLLRQQRVLTAGHPFPGPFNFCNVINAALTLILWLWF